MLQVLNDKYEKNNVTVVSISVYLPLYNYLQINHVNRIWKVTKWRGGLCCTGIAEATDLVEFDWCLKVYLLEIAYIEYNTAEFLKSL